MNKIILLFKQQKKVLSIYLTAGYPKLDDTLSIVESLADAGVDLIEIGMPYSDPLADGPVIQASSTKALENGMTLDLLFEQVRKIRQKTTIPLVWMGYYNCVLQYGAKRFFETCKESGIDGLIIPDLPLLEYEQLYQSQLEALDLCIAFLITPESSTERIALIDRLSRGFVYLVSDSATTGSKEAFDERRIAYFERIAAMNLQQPTLIGFGIQHAAHFEQACRYAAGAIIGSAFIKTLSQANNPTEAARFFIQSINNTVSIP